MAVKSKSKKTKTGLSAVPLDRGFQQCHWFFNDEIDRDSVSKVLKEWVRSNFSRDEAKAILANPEWNFSMYNGRAAAAFWESKGLEIDDERYARYPEFLRETYSNLIGPGKEILRSRAPDTSDSNHTRLSPLELLARKVNETVLTDLDVMEDEWIMGQKSTRDMYQLFKVHEIKGQQAIKQVEDHVSEKLTELIDARDARCEQAQEAYEHLGKKELDRRISVYEQMVSDLEKIRSATKAIRKTRKRKAKTADKQVKDLKYLKENNEYKLASINPEQIPGSIRLYTFNTKTRVLTEYVTLSKSGFEVKGTTIQNHDPETSRAVKLRKPDEFLPRVLSKTPRQIDKDWSTLTTKTTNSPNGRINEDTILLRVLDK